MKICDVKAADKWGMRSQEGTRHQNNGVAGRSACKRVKVKGREQLLGRTLQQAGTHGCKLLKWAKLQFRLTSQVPYQTLPWFFVFMQFFFACVLMLVAISLPLAYAGSAYGSFDCCQLGCVLVRWAGICALLLITELEVCTMTIAERGKTALQPCNLVWAWWKCTRQTTKLTLEWLVAVSLLIKTWTSLFPPVPG